MPRRARLFCGYDQNTNESATTGLNNWTDFSYPSSGISIWRQEGEPVLEVLPNRVAFTWSGPPTWFKLDAICNVYKGSGGNTSINIEMCWFKNEDIPYGFIRGSHMNNQDSNIVSGSGWLLINTGDTIYPKIRNIENNDTVLLKNCTFTFWADEGY